MGVDFPEPGETVTYCFAIATWHLIGKIARVISVFSRASVVLPQKDIYTNLQKCYQLLSLPGYHT